MILIIVIFSALGFWELERDVPGNSRQVTWLG